MSTERAARRCSARSDAGTVCTLDRHPISTRHTDRDGNEWGGIIPMGYISNPSQDITEGNAGG